MSVTAIFASLTVLFAALLAAGFFLLRLPKRPRCGGREWVPAPHRGRYAAYCRNCAQDADMSDWSWK